MNKKISDRYNSVVICGPTACGKTSIAVSLARMIGGEIISADSRQVYRGMDIGSGKDLAEYSTAGEMVPYHMIDIASPHEAYSLYDYMRDFRNVFNNAIARGVTPVICGGTGLYIESVLKNYAVPSVPEDESLRNELMSRDTAYLLEKLEKFPAVFAATDISSKKRIVRALEIAYRGGGEELTRRTGDTFVNAPVYVVHYDRPTVIQRINMRLMQRLGCGMIEEVEKLIADGVSKERLLQLGMEYKYIALYLHKELTYDEMVESLRTSIHRLAKRQMTWFRGMQRRGVETRWIDAGKIDPMEFIAKDVPITA